MGKKTGKNDLILIGMLLAIAFAAYIFLRLAQGSLTGGEAVVMVEGTEYGRYPLGEERMVRIVLKDGAYNVLVIKDGKADITDASCPDKICVRHRAVDKKGQSIVCLPNKVVVEIGSGKEDDVDLMIH